MAEILRPLLLFTLLLLVHLDASGATPKPRPYSGSGVLIIRPFPPEISAGITTVTLYRNPGVGRIGDMATKKLPGLAPVLLGANGASVVAVMEKKGSWLKIAYNEAGEEGWVALTRTWRYFSWEEYLKERGVRLLPGLKIGHLILWSDSSPTSRQLETLSRQRNLRILRIKDDWIFVLVDLTISGWLRWRDEDGRFLIAIDETVTPQNR